MDPSNQIPYLLKIHSSQLSQTSFTRSQKQSFCVVYYFCLYKTGLSIKNVIELAKGGMAAQE